METQQLTEFKRYLDILSRKKELILSGILLGITCGLIFYMIMPKIYQSDALLSYQQQKLNPSQMSPDEQAGIRDIVSTLSQIVMSRSSLEKIIQEENLYAEMREHLPMEDVVEFMRNDINIIQSRDGDTFVIEYVGSDPRKVVRVTNALAARFIEENLQYREERASETSAYTQNELDMAKEMLDKKETVMRDYKLKYYNEMPDQRAINMSRLIALQDQYQGKQESIQDFERTRVLLQDQINVRKQLIEENQQLIQIQQANEQGQSTVIEINQKAKLEMLQNGLVALQDRYTDQHPQVKRLKKQISGVEQLIAEEERKSKEEPDSDNQRQQYDNELFSLQIQLKDIGLSINKLENEKEETKVLIKKYEEWVASAPIREAEWSSLTREYGEMKRQYDFLVAQNLQAISALNLERKQKGSQFKIEDPARVPETPLSPKFPKTMIIAMFAGLFAGGMLAVGLEVVDTSLKSQFDVEQEFDLSVICSVPNFALSGEIATKRIWSFCKAAFFLIWTSAICLVLLNIKTDGKVIAYATKLFPLS